MRDPRGKTPLMWAAAYGQTPTVNKLLQAGADVGAMADESETALHLAASNGHHDVVRMLLNQVTERASRAAFIRRQKVRPRPRQSHFVRPTHFLCN